MNAPHQEATEWWTTFHMAEMADVLLARTSEQVDTTIGFLERELELTPGQRIFDQCCGSGDLAIPLAKRGFIVTGCDLFAPYIDRAITQAGADQWSADQVEPTFVCADAFAFVPDQPCDVVINWFSSFGYAADDDVNRTMLARAVDSLVTSGRFAIEVPNIAGILRGFQTTLVQQGMSDGRSVRIERDCKPDFETGLLHQRWQWQIEGEAPVERHSAMKMYLPNRVCELMEEVGLGDLQLFGSDAGEPFEMDSPRLLITARKAR